MKYLSLIGRDEQLFGSDILMNSERTDSLISLSSFLVIGGAGSIGQAVTKEIFKRNPKLLHVVDISENNMVELVRDIRSTEGYGAGEFRTFAVDCGSVEFEALVKAVKEARSIVTSLWRKCGQGKTNNSTLWRIEYSVKK